MKYQPPARSARAGPGAGQEVQASRHPLPHLLHGVPSMNPRKDLAAQTGRTSRNSSGTARGKKYWRSLEELADTEAFQELMRQEFPEQASVWPTAAEPAAFPDADGRLAGPGGLERLLGPAGPVGDSGALTCGRRKRSCRASRCSMPPP